MANVWRIAILLLVTLAALPAVARAQEPRVSIAGGYVYLQQQAAGNLPSASYPFGWMGTAGFRLGASRVSAVGEFGISWQANDFDERQQLMAVLGGASVTLFRSNRVAIFAQGLAGLERFSEPGLVESGVAVQPGGGIDFYVSSKVFIRGQGDYRWSEANGSTFHAFRLVAAVGIAIK